MDRAEAFRAYLSLFLEERTGEELPLGVDGHTYAAGVQQDLERVMLGLFASTPAASSEEWTQGPDGTKVRMETDVDHFDEEEAGIAGEIEARLRIATALGRRLAEKGRRGYRWASSNSGMAAAFAWFDPDATAPDLLAAFQRFLEGK